MTEQVRVVTSVDERAGSNSQHLWAHVDVEGNLHVDGKDFGPQTDVLVSRFSSDQGRELEKVLTSGVVPVAFQRW
jgi:hypothetical protein